MTYNSVLVSIGGIIEKQRISVLLVLPRNQTLAIYQNKHK